MTTATMTFFTIDTLQFSKRLQKAGLEQRIAEELSEAIKETQNQAIEGLANKNDVLLVRKDLEVLKQNIVSLDQKFEQKFETLEYKLTVKMFLAMIAAVSIVTWLDKVIR